MSDLRETLLEIARAGWHKPGRVIASFASARDARAFAVLKREEGQDVTITTGNPEGPCCFDVRTLVKSL